MAGRETTTGWQTAMKKKKIKRKTENLVARLAK